MADVHYENVYYSGRVQGVGFRFQTLQIAKEFEVAGYVKNLADGRVQVEVEGAPEAVAAFLTAMDERLHGYIRKIERAASERSPQFRGFAIR